MQNEYKKKHDDLNAKFKQKAEEFKQLYTNELTNLKNEYYNAIKVLESKNTALSNEVNELRDYLVKRPSKDEDIEMINNLKEEMKLLEKKMADSDSLIEQFRNELLNREETYNGYFDRRPKVGYVNPIKDKNKTVQMKKVMGGTMNMSGNAVMPLIKK